MMVYSKTPMEFGSTNPLRRGDAVGVLGSTVVRHTALGALMQEEESMASDPKRSALDKRPDPIKLEDQPALLVIHGPRGVLEVRLVVGLLVAIVLVETWRAIEAHREADATKGVERQMVRLIHHFEAGTVPSKEASDGEQK